MTDTLIQNRLSVLTPEYRSFIESDFIAEAANSFGQMHAFTERQVEILENALTLYLLFFLNDQEIATFISRNCALSPADATELFLAITSILPAGITATVGASYAAIHGQTTGTTQLASEIAETEQAFAALQGIRTMAGDMNAIKHPNEPVYTSSQAEILNRGGQEKTSDTPRWDTER